MDVWQARSDQPSPVVFYIHGGGWQAQDKTDIHDYLDVRAFLEAGISVVSINYRFLQDANDAHVAPPVQWPLEDAKRALQFLRTKAGAWHLDKTRIATSGVSAGGASALWLAMHDEMAEPASADPVARESTRCFCAAVIAPVVCLDPLPLREWIPNAIFGAHAFGYANLSRADSFAPFLAARESFLPDIRRYSPIDQASADDPPVFVDFPAQDKRPCRAIRRPTRIIPRSPGSCWSGSWRRSACRWNCVIATTGRPGTRTRRRISTRMLAGKDAAALP